MPFSCIACEQVYLAADDGLPTITGICPPCGRSRLGDEHYDRAMDRADLQNSRRQLHPGTTGEGSQSALDANRVAEIVADTVQQEG